MKTATTTTTNTTKTTRSQTTTTSTDTNNQTTSTSSSPLQTEGDSGLLSSELVLGDVQIVDIKNIKKFTRQEAEAGVDSLDLDSGRPSSIASGGDKTVTIDGSIHDGFDIDDLDEDYSKKSYKEGYEVSDSNDVSMQLDLEDEDIFDPKDDNMFSALNIKLEKIKNDTDKVTPNIVKNTTEFFEEINTFRAHQIRIYIVCVGSASTSIAPIIIIWCNVITSV